MADINEILRQMQMNMAAQNQASAAKSVTKGAVPLLFGATDTQFASLSPKVGWADNPIGGQGGAFGAVLSSGGTYGLRGGPGAVRSFANSVNQGFKDAAQGAPAYQAAIAHNQSAMMSQIAFSGNDFIGPGAGLSRTSTSFVATVRPNSNEIT